MIAYSRKIVAFLVWLTASAQVFPSYAEAYRNREYGFRVDTLRDHAVCKDTTNGHEHGVAIPFDSGGCSTLKDDKRPYTDISAEYNTGFYFSSRADAQSLCEYGIHDAEKPKLGNPPSALKIPGRISAVCRLDYRNGWINLTVVTEAGTWKDVTKADGPEWKAPEISYSVFLHTTTKRFDKDLTVFRSILRTVQIFER